MSGAYLILSKAFWESSIASGMTQKIIEIIFLSLGFRNYNSAIRLSVRAKESADFIAKDFHLC
jgi:hypothetical protein